MSDADVRRPRPLRVVVAAVLATATGALPVFLLGGVAVQVRAELGFGEARLGLAVTLFFALSAVGSAAAGRLTEQLGVHRTMLTTALVAVVAFTIIALAPAWWAIAAGLAVGALANALAPPAANLLLARGVDRRRQALAFGLKQSAVPLTSLLGGLAVPLFALTLGWRWAFAAGAVMACTLVLVAPRDADRTATWSRARRGSVPVLVAGAKRPLVVLAVGAAFANIGSNSLGVFLVESLVAQGAAEAVAGLALMVGSAVGIGVRVTLGWWADRVDRELFFGVAAAMMLTGALGYMLLATGRLALAGPAIVLAFGAGWGWNGLYSFSVVAANREAPAAATGIAQAGLFAGAMAGPGIAGLLIERSGFALAWGTLAVSMIVAGGCMVVGARLIGARAQVQVAADASEPRVGPEAPDVPEGPGASKGRERPDA